MASYGACGCYYGKWYLRSPAHLLLSRTPWGQCSRSKWSPLWGRGASGSGLLAVRDDVHGGKSAQKMQQRWSMAEKCVNSLWPNDTIWRQRSGSTLAQVMACCLTAPSLYPNQCWLIISEVKWHSYKGNFTRDASTINHQNLFENYI